GAGRGGWGGSTGRGASPRSAGSARRSRSRVRPPASASPARRWVSTPTRCCGTRATPTTRSPHWSRRARWPGRPRPGSTARSWGDAVAAEGMLKMSELAEQSGVSAGTIKHYLREGLLPEPVRTSRNMAYYPPEFVERIRLIKRLQEDRFMPLRLIKGVIEEDPERARALIELEDR